MKKGIKAFMVCWLPGILHDSGIGIKRRIKKAGISRNDLEGSKGKDDNEKS